MIIKKLQLPIFVFLAGSNFYWTQSHAVGGAAFASSASRSQTPAFLNVTGDSEPIKRSTTPVPTPILHPTAAPATPAAVTASPTAVAAVSLSEPLNDAQIGGSDGSAKVSPCNECGASIL